jgi:hypothetical protein
MTQPSGTRFGPSGGWTVLETRDIDALIEEVKSRRNAHDKSPLVATEVRIDGSIGPAKFGSGGPEERPRIDFVLVTWPSRFVTIPEITIVECKSSVRDRLEHYVQIGTYAALLTAKLESKNLRWKTQGLIVRRPAPSVPMPAPEVERAEFAREAAEGLVWLSREELASLEVDIRKQLETVEGSSSDDPVRFSSSCESCVYNQSCLSNAVADLDGERSLELLCIPVEEQRGLRNAGLRWSDDDWLPAQDAARAAGFRSGWSDLLDLRRLRHAYYKRKTTEIEVASTGFARLPNVDAIVRDAPFLQIFVTTELDPFIQRFQVLGARPVLWSLNGGCETLTPSFLAGNGEIGDATREATLLADFTRHLRRVIDEALLRHPDGLYIHIYAWRHEEIAGLAKRCLDLIDREGISEVGEIHQLLHFLTCHEGLKHLEETKNLDVEERWEERVFTGLHEEAERRLRLGAIGTTLIETSCLRWGTDVTADGLASDCWIADPVLAPIPFTLGVSAVDSA